MLRGMLLAVVVAIVALVVSARADASPRSSVQVCDRAALGAPLLVR